MLEMQERDARGLQPKPRGKRGMRTARRVVRCYTKGADSEPIDEPHIRRDVVMNTHWYEIEKDDYHVLLKRKNGGWLIKVTLEDYVKHFYYLPTGKREKSYLKRKSRIMPEITKKCCAGDIYRELYQLELLPEMDEVIDGQWTVEEIRKKWSKVKGLSDDEVEYGITHFTQLAVLANEAGPVFRLAAWEAERVKEVLETFRHNRKIVEEGKSADWITNSDPKEKESREDLLKEIRELRATIKKLEKEVITANNDYLKISRSQNREVKDWQGKP